MNIGVLLVARPPRILVEAQICKEDELREISHAVYGLNDAPAAWAAYRDSEIAKLLRAPEQNLWRMVKVKEGNIPGTALKVFWRSMSTTFSWRPLLDWLMNTGPKWTCSQPEPSRS